MNKKLLLIALIVFTVALGFLRDHIFVSINHSIETGNDADGKLSLLKWALTGVFSLIYLSGTCAFLYTLFHSKKYIWMAFIAYGILFMISFIAALSGYFFSSFGNVYLFIRTVMGVAQSPIVMMILIAICYLNLKAQSK